MLSGLVLALAMVGSSGFQEDGETIAFRCGKILTQGKQGVLHSGVILVRAGKIVAVGPKVPISDGATVIDARGRWTLPGLVDLHCHSGGTGWDINDMVFPTNPGLSTKPTIEPDNELLRLAQAGGVTTVLYIPGSGTNLGGFGVLMKTGGADSVEGLILRYPGAMKVAQAWNPERDAGDLGASRAGMWWLLRKTLDRGKRYHDAWNSFEKGMTRIPPAVEPDLEKMRGLFAGRFPVIIHTADQRDMMGTVRMFHDRYGVPVILSHGEDRSYLVAPEIAKRNLHVDVGPRIYDPPFWSFRERFIGIPLYYHSAGVRKLSINTDSPVVPQEDLTVQAAMAVRYGLPVRVALDGVTIAPARAVLADDRVGSIEVGKDADIVLWSGPPLDVRSHVVLTMINGRVVYDLRRDRRRY